MKATAPIITCDSEDGCAEWEMDWYEMTASNWHELMGEWKYDPYGDPNAYILCPYHAKEADE